MVAPSESSTATRRSGGRSRATRRVRVGLEELPAKHVPEDDGQKNVDGGEGYEWHDQSGHRGDRVRGTHHAVDDPRLAADLGDEPPRLDRDEAERTGDDQRAQEPRIVGQPPPPPEPRGPGCQAKHGEPGAHHQVEGPVNDARIWPFVPRY